MFNEKINDKIHFPIYGLDMAPYVLDPSQKISQNGLIYDLHGVINHYGELNYGHYVACAKNSITDQWHTYNDSMVSSTVVENEIVSDAAYVLFYKLRGYEESVGLANPSHEL